MRTSLYSAALLLGVLAFAECAEAGTPRPPDPAGRAGAGLFVPDGLSDRTAVPVVMVLHGCLQNEQNMIDETRFTELAERDRFIVVFPFITSYPFVPARAQNSWGFFIEQHRHEGLGEPSDLRRVLDAVEDEFPIDPARRYVAGLSSGAAMALVMAVAYSEDIAAAGAVAGLPYGEDACAVANVCFTGIAHKPVDAFVEAMQAEQQSAEERRLVPIMAIHSTNDMTVPIRNAHNVRDSWIAYYDVDASPAATEDCTTEGVSCEHARFTDQEGRTVVETVFYSGTPFGTTHYWVGDNAGIFADPDGPSASELLWAFFREHTLAAGTRADIDIPPAEVAGTSARIRGTVGARQGIEQVLVRLDGDAPQVEGPAEGTTSFWARFDDLPDDQRYTPVVHVVFDDGTSQAVAGTEFVIGEPPEEAPVETVRRNFHEQILAGRIAVQRPPCVHGLGVCDAVFNTLFFQHGLEVFALHNPAGTTRWYLDPAHIPPLPPAPPSG